MRALADDGRCGRVEWSDGAPLHDHASELSELLRDADRMQVVSGLAPDERAVRSMADRLGLSDDSTWRCLDGWTEHRRGGTIRSMRCGWGPSWMPDGTAILYHGCEGSAIAPEGRSVAARGNGLWLSPSRAFACCFAIPAIREGRMMQGVDLLQARPKVVISAAPDELRAAIARRTANLHRIGCAGRHCGAPGACKRFEYLARGSFEVLAVETRDCEEMLRHYEVEQESPELDEVGVFASFQVPSETWRAALGEERETVERFASFRRLARTWLPEFLQRPARSIPGLRPEESLRHLRRMVLPDLAERFEWPEVAGHDERHAWVVAHLALLLAFESEAPPVTAALAGALHDCARDDDCDDPHDPDGDHAARSAARAEPIIRELESLHPSPETVEAIAGAIREHRFNTVPSSPVSACLRDADRLGLAWERGFEPRYFSTPLGAHLARTGPAEAERLFRRCFHETLFGSAPVDPVPCAR